MLCSVKEARFWIWSDGAVEKELTLEFVLNVEDEVKSSAWFGGKTGPFSSTLVSGIVETSEENCGGIPVPVCFKWIRSAWC